MDRAVARAAQGDPSGAEADLEKAVQMAPQAPVTYARLAEFRSGQKRYPEAEKLFQQALALDPNFVEALDGLVQMDMDEKQPAVAVRLVEAQIAKEPGNGAYEVTLGKLEAQAKDYGKAEAAAAKAVDLNGKDLAALQLLGEMQEAEGKPDQAILTLEQAIAVSPDDPFGYSEIGQIEDSRGNWQQAQTWYQKALQVRPDYPLAANNLAYIMLQHNLGADMALSLAQAARRGLPDSPEVNDTLGWAYYEKGVYGSAVTQLQEAVKNNPRNPSYHYHLGLAYAKLGDRAKARTELQHILETNPDFAQTAEVRQALAQITR
jgi:tetratricopeptide (TPR) repeat protein